MADLSSITLPNGSNYNLKDSSARTSAVYYGACSTSASTQTKEVTISGVTEYYTGLHVRIKFSNAQSYNGTPKLKINSLSAVDIQRASGTGMVQYDWPAGGVVDFVYDGTNFIGVRSSHATTTYYGVTKLSSSTSSTSDTLAATASAVKAAYDLAGSKQAQIATDTLTAYANEWSGNGPWEQEIAPLYTVTSYTKVDIQAEASTISQMIADGVRALYVENNSGTLTLIAVGACPTVNLPLQLTFTEVGS